LNRLYLFLFPEKFQQRRLGLAVHMNYEFEGGFYRVEVKTTHEAECRTKNPILTRVGFFNKGREINFGFDKKSTTTTTELPTTINTTSITPHH